MGDAAEYDSLSQDLNTLVSSEDIDLSIGQRNQDFIPVSPTLSKRIITLLDSHSDAVSKVADIGDYDLILKFNGYSDIHLHFETNTFWFEGADHLYPMQHSFSEQWDRYIIRMIEDELMYDTLEKSILQKSTFVDRDGRKNTATLFYDGDIRLQINRSETVIASNVSEISLDYYDSGYPRTSYYLKILDHGALFAVVNDFYTVHGKNTKLDVFSYENEYIHPVFSTSDLTFELEAIDYEHGEVKIRLPFANTTMNHVLTKEERAMPKEKLIEFRRFTDLNKVFY